MREIDETIITIVLTISCFLCLLCCALMQETTEVKVKVQETERKGKEREILDTLLL